MSDIPTKEQLKLKKDKDAIAAMKAARDNMTTAIARIDQLEICIANLSSLIDSVLEHVSPRSYVFDSRQTQKEAFIQAKREAMRCV